MYELLVFLLKYIKINAHIYSSTHNINALNTALNNHNSSFVRILIHIKAVDISDMFCKSAFYECFDIVNLLVHQGVDVNVKNHFYHSAIHYASACGHLETIKLLIAHGAIMDNADYPNSRTLLHVASEYGQLNVVQFLVENGANVDDTWIHDSYIDTNEPPNCDFTALDMASMNGHYNVMRYLMNVKCRNTGEICDVGCQTGEDSI